MSPNRPSIAECSPQFNFKLFYVIVTSQPVGALLPIAQHRNNPKIENEDSNARSDESFGDGIVHSAKFLVRVSIVANRQSAANLGAVYEVRSISIAPGWHPGISTSSHDCKSLD